MKLISLHVDSFGTLKNFDYQFDSKINSILEENGWGKTTLCYFLKAMFYGLPRCLKHDLNENERKKYTPWQGDSFGGTLTFEYKNNKYRIERSFKSNAANDTCRVVDLSTNRLTNIFGGSIGDTIFGLNRDSFSRSMFMSQEVFKYDFGDDLKSKLSNLFGRLDDSQSAVDAKDAVAKKYKEINKEIKNDLVPVKEVAYNSVLDKKQSIMAIPNIEKTIAYLKLKKEELETERSVLTKKFTDIEESTNIKNNINSANILKSKIQEATNQKDELLKINNISSSDSIDINGLESVNTELKTKSELLKTYKVNESDLQKWHELNPLFVNGIPTEKEFDDISNKINSFNVPVAPLVEEQPVATKRKLSPLSISLIVIGLLLLFGGIGIIFVSLVAGIIVAILGFVSLFASIFIALLSNNHQQQNIQVGPRAVYDPKIQLEILSFFSKYQIEGLDFNSNLYTLKAKVETYTRINNSILENNKKYNETKANIDDLNNKFASLIKGLDCSNCNNNDEVISKLRNTKTKLEELNRNINSLTNEYTEFVSNHTIKEVKEDQCLTTDEINEQLKKIDIEINKYIKEIADRNVKLSDLKDDEQTLLDDQNKYDDLNRKIKLKNKKVSLLKKTEEILEKTDEQIKKLYVKPMSEKVAHHLSRVLGKDDINFELDTNFTFNGIESTKARELDYYSSGYKEVIAMCLRLSLIECLFKDEKPFLILDDTLANMDDYKMCCAKDYIRELSDKNQILYFTCQKAREI